MECVVHYNQKSLEYSDLKALSENQYEKLVEAKKLRLETVGPNEHAEQCSSIPDNGFDVNKHGVHLDPCYKKFTLIISNDRKRKSDVSPKGSKRLSNEALPSTSGNFPKVCFACKKVRKTIKKKIYLPYTITTAKAAQKIKDAAELKNDSNLLTRIRGVDLIAKELMTHKQCYTEYTRCISEETNVRDDNEGKITLGNYEAVRAFVSNAILDCCKAVSITVLHELYGTGFGHEHEKSYRNKLKKRLIKEFGNLLTFKKIDGKTPEVVISTAGLNSTSLVKDKNFDSYMGRMKFYKGKKTKDANKPKRATSAYFYFMASCREQAKKAGKNVSKVLEFSKECSEKWKNMNATQRKPFDEKAAKDKVRYEKEMAEYKGKSSGDIIRPKRPQTSYFLFLADFKKNYVPKEGDKNQGISAHKIILKEAGEKWRALPLDEKKHYDKKSEEEVEKYKVAMAEYKKKSGGSVKGGSSAKKAKIAIEPEDEEEEGGESEDDDDS